MTLYLFFSGGGYSQVMDQSISVGQLVVAHRHNLFIFRTSEWIVVLCIRQGCF